MVCLASVIGRSGVWLSLASRNCLMFYCNMPLMPSNVWLLFTLITYCVYTNTCPSGGHKVWQFKRRNVGTLTESWCTRVQFVHVQSRDLQQNVSQLCGVMSVLNERIPFHHHLWVHILHLSPLQIWVKNLSHRMAFVERQNQTAATKL